MLHVHAYMLLTIFFKLLVKSIILILVLCVSVRLSVRPREISGTKRRIAVLLTPA